jgi:hypothetical protein
MKKQQACGLVTAGILTALVAGCATMGYDRAGQMASKMQQTRQDVLGARSQVTATFNALDTVMRAQVGDLRPLVTSYSKELSSLEKTAEKTKWRAQNIRESGAVYFSAWAQEIEAIGDSEMRANSMKRREQTLADYKAVEQSLIAVRDAYYPLLKDLRDIEKTMQQDLTSAGVAAVKPAHQRARQKAIDLQGLMTQSLGVIDRVVNGLAPTAVR